MPSAQYSLTTVKGKANIEAWLIDHNYGGGSWSVAKDNTGIILNNYAQLVLGNGEHKIPFKIVYSTSDFHISGPLASPDNLPSKVDGLYHIKGAEIKTFAKQPIMSLVGGVTLDNCYMLTDCRGLTVVNSLHLVNCDALTTLEGLYVHHPGGELSIAGCDALVSLKGIPNFLDKLSILNCSKLETLEYFPLSCGAFSSVGNVMLHKYLLKPLVSKNIKFRKRPNSDPYFNIISKYNGPDDIFKAASDLLDEGFNEEAVMA